MVLPHGGWPVHRDLFSTFGRFIGESVKKRSFSSRTLLYSRVWRNGASPARVRQQGGVSTRKICAPRRPRRSRRGCKEAGRHAREASRADRIEPRLVPLGRPEARRHAQEAGRVTKFGPSRRHRVSSGCHVRVIWASSSAIWVRSGCHVVPSGAIWVSSGRHLGVMWASSSVISVPSGCHLVSSECHLGAIYFTSTLNSTSTFYSTSTLYFS